MALSTKISKAIKDAQKQAEAAVADVRGQLDVKLPEVTVDPTPFYAIVGAADIALDTVRTAAEQLETARDTAKRTDLGKQARKEAQDLQKDLQQRIAELQSRTADLQALAARYANRFVAQAQELPAQVLNQGLVIASNAKDQYDAAAVRGEQVVAELRTQGTKAAVDLAERSEAAVTRGRKVAETAATEGGKVAQTLRETVSDDARKVQAQVESSVDAVERAGAPVEVHRTAARRTAVRKAAAKQAAATRKVERAAAPAPSPAKATAKKAAPASATKKAATPRATKKAATARTTRKAGS